jgi:hypothetical protein
MFYLARDQDLRDVGGRWLVLWVCLIEMEGGICDCGINVIGNIWYMDQENK